MQAALREKLGEEMEPYLILGARNPPLAHRALAADCRIGPLLPCNVVIRAHDGHTVVEALNPQMMVAVAGEQSLQPVADGAAYPCRGSKDLTVHDPRSCRRHPGRYSLGSID